MTLKLFYDCTVHWLIICFKPSFQKCHQIWSSNQQWANGAVFPAGIAIWVKLVIMSSKSVCSMHCLNKSAKHMVHWQPMVHTIARSRCLDSLENIVLLCNIQYFRWDASLLYCIIHSHIWHNIHYQSKVEHTLLSLFYDYFHILEYYKSFQNYDQKMLNKSKMSFIWASCTFWTFMRCIKQFWISVFWTLAVI